MNKKLLTLAAATMIAPFSTAMAADAMPTVYGKVFVTYDFEDVDNNGTDGDTWEINSNASRVGVKGELPITDSLSAVYKLEYEVFVDDGDDGSGDEFKQRNIYGGVKGGFGQVILGKFDTPVKKAQGKVDLFNDTAGDIKNVMEGENREDNLIQYSSPKLGNLQFHVAGQPGEENEATGCSVALNNDCQDGPVDAFSASVVFNGDNFFLAAAVDDAIDERDTVRAVAKIDLDALELGVIAQVSEANDDFAAVQDEETAVVASAAFTMGKFKLKGQVGMSELDDDVAGTPDEEIELVALGVDYKMSKNTTLTAYAISKETTDAGNVDGVDNEADTIGAGFIIKF